MTGITQRIDNRGSAKDALLKEANDGLMKCRDTIYILGIKDREVGLVLFTL